MKKLLVSIYVTALIGGVQAAGDGFVRVDNGRFTIDGRPYSYVGTNFWYGAILGSEGEGGDRERLLRELDFMKSAGIDNLRILVGADGPDGVASKVEPALQSEPGVYNERILDGLDYLMTEMGRRGMRAVLYLNNSWEWSGGYGQYLQWAGAGRAPIPAIDGWAAFGDYVKQYATNDKAHELFAKHVEFIVSRTNRYTGLKYADDPTLMAWQIGNEPRAFGDKNRERFVRWMAETAAQIKSLDPGHLVSTGSEGMAGCEGDIDLWEQLHADRNVDYMTIHVWPNNWGWIHKKSMNEELPRAIDNTRAYVDMHAAIALKHGKPLVMEEFGFPRDGFAFDRKSPTRGRDAYYAAVFDMIGRGVFAGCNFWAWGGFAQPAHTFWQKGDDYVGDPAQEEQGLNSVFDTDTTTIALISRYAEQLGSSARSRSPEAEKLLDRLRKIPSQGTMFGHQDDTAYGVDWFGEQGRSDVQSVCGDYPAVIGFDLGRIEHGSEKNIDGVPFDLMRREIIAQRRRGGMVTISWHADNPLTGGDSWDAKGGAVTSVLPGGERHELFRTWLDRVAAFLNSLTDERGVKIPVLFRPWHENTGGWFWWGAGHRSDGEYRRLWRATWEELRRAGADHLLWAYSPNADDGFVEHYDSHYPGDDVVDLLGFDSYHFGPAPLYKAVLRQSLDGLEILGKKHGKPIAITEVGLEGLKQTDWWTNVLLAATVDRPLVYILAWRNAHDRPGHFYAPYPGQTSAADFIKYYDSPRTLFCRDIKLYD